MAKRSLQASPAGIQRVRRAFALKGWTQENLAGEVNLKTRQPIWRLFTGQPVDRQIFMDVCQILDLDWRDIASHPPEDFPDPDELSEPSLSELEEPDIDALVATVRSQHRETIQQRCGILQLLDIHHPVNLDDI
jgi:predicted NACHT family NTPase